jgi:hypothetical protein
MSEKVCRCCGARYSAEGWAALPFIGVQVIDPNDGLPPDVLELRNCKCESTLAIPIEGKP